MALPSTCVVYLWMKDLLGADITNATFSVRGGSFAYGQEMVTLNYASSSFDSNGYAQLQVVESVTPGVTYQFSIKYKIKNTFKQIEFEPVKIPNTGSINLCTIATIRGQTS